MRQKRDNLTNSVSQSADACSICKDLLVRIEQSFDMMMTTQRQTHMLEWLTVDDIAKELKISKSIVYRFIRNGEIEAIDVVESNGRIAQRGHYRISRSSLNKYLESRRVKTLPDRARHNSHSKSFPKGKNYLGI